MGEGSFKGAGTARFSGGEQKVAQVVAGRGLHFLPEEPQESLQQIDLMGLHPLQPGVGEQVRDGAAGGLLHPIEHRLELARQRQGIEATSHPAIEAVGEQLAAQDEGGIEITAGRFHLPLQHLARIGKEVEVVGGACDQGAHHGIAVAAASPADALQVVGRLRRHGGKQHGGEIADVDAHLQGGGGREQVGITAVFAADELGFEPLAIGPLQQTGVLAGHDAVHLAAAVEASIKLQTPVGRTTAGISAIVAVAVAHLAGHAIPEAELFTGHAVLIAALLAAHGMGLTAHGDGGGRNAPDALAPPAVELLQQAGLGEGVHHGVEGFFLLLGIEGRWRAVG